MHLIVAYKIIINVSSYIESIILKLNVVSRRYEKPGNEKKKIIS